MVRQSRIITGTLRRQGAGQCRPQYLRGIEDDSTGTLLLQEQEP